jgi:hypothetical protein
MLQEIVYDIQGKSNLVSPLGTNKTTCTNPEGFSLSNSLSSSTSIFTTALHHSHSAPSSSSSASSSSSSAPSKLRSKHLFKDALTFSRLHYGNDLLNELSNVSISSFPLLSELQTLLSSSRMESVPLSEIQSDIPLIQQYLILENEKLQLAITQLQTTIEQDSADDFLLSTNKEDVGKVKKSGNNSTLNKQEKLSANRIMEAKISGANQMRNRTGYRDNAIALSKEDHFLDDETLQKSDNVRSNNNNNNNNNNLHEEIRKPDSGSGRSKFREKLKGAQDELFFSDDF